MAGRRSAGLKKAELPASTRITANGLNFTVVDAGNGPAILLLHGFPDSSYVWRNQVAALVIAGYRVIAPDLRGFGGTDKPEGVKAYAMGELIRDLRRILRALGVPRVHVVGHDWGAALAWMFAITQPQRVDRLVAISVGHPGNFTPRSMRQMQLSWYSWLFQVPGLMEELMPRDDWRFLRSWLGPSADIDRIVKNLSQPGALTAGLNWYRANDPPQRLLEPTPTYPPIEHTVMGIFGAHEFALTEDSMTGSAAYVSGPWRYERFDDAGHWVQLDQPDKLNRLLLDFLKRGDEEVPTDARARLMHHDAGLATRLKELKDA
jgi:pimeloyl-ACP methyl ester carboxylesterase